MFKRQSPFELRCPQRVPLKTIACLPEHSSWDGKRRKYCRKFKKKKRYNNKKSFPLFSSGSALQGWAGQVPSQPGRRFHSWEEEPAPSHRLPPRCYQPLWDAIPRIPLTTDSPGLEILKNKLRRRRAIMERGLARRPTAGTAITGRKTKPRPHGSTATTATASWGPYLQEHCHMKYSHEVPHLTLATDGEGKRTVTAVVGVLCGEGSSPLVGCAQITTG